MPTQLGRKYSLNWRGSPPHMLTSDVPVWYRWLDRNDSLVSSLYYDCLLGGPFLSQEAEKDPFSRMWRYNTSKRADAIVETTNNVLIIEVSDYPGLRAAGQLLVYQSLWIEDPKILKPETLVLVCSRIDNDLGSACAKFGIQLHLV